ncbi:hypothetical protein [Nocardia gipuzkoensis]
MSESGGVDRATEAGTLGAVQPCSAHQDSHLPTAARRAFQVFTAAVPQRVSSAAPTSVSVTESRARLVAVSPCGRPSSWSTVLAMAMP